MDEHVMVRSTYITLKLLLDIVSNKDLDECFNGTHDCLQICHNTAGFYTCACNIGYHLDSDGQSCNGIMQFSVIRLLVTYYYIFKISMSAMKAAFCVVNSVTIQLDRMCVPATMDTVWELMDILVMV